MAAVTDELGETARDSLQVLFVSIDPTRDDPDTLRQYTAGFGPEFIGLTGDKAALDALTRRFHVTYHGGGKNEDGTAHDAVSHSSAVFAFDREETARC